MVEMNYIDSISHTTVGKILKANDLKPHLVEEWCIPKEQSADFAACMEDVLEVYSRPYDERYPVVCMDEMATFLHYSTGTFGSHGKNQC